MGNRVMLATPFTLLAVLRGVALAWYQRQILERAEDIAKQSQEMYRRVAKFSEHLTRVHDGLERACRAYNEASASWRSRVMPQGRRVEELGGGSAKDQKLHDLGPIEMELHVLPPPEEDQEAEEAEEGE